jgi:hypothetical protein
VRDFSLHGSIVWYRLLPISNLIRKKQYLSGIVNLINNFIDKEEVAMPICTILVNVLLFSDLFLVLMVLSFIPVVVDAVIKLRSGALDLFRNWWLVPLIPFSGLILSAFIYVLLTPARGACYEEHIKIIYSILNIVY